MIVRRTACDWLNKNRPAAIVLAEDLEDLECTQLPNADGGTAEGRLIDREEETLFENAIAALPAHYRQTFALRHLGRHKTFIQRGNKTREPSVFNLAWPAMAIARSPSGTVGTRLYGDE
jgi:hypothetical protein